PAATACATTTGRASAPTTVTIAAGSAPSAVPDGHSGVARTSARWIPATPHAPGTVTHWCTTAYPRSARCVTTAATSVRSRRAGPRSRPAPGTTDVRVTPRDHARGTVVRSTAPILRTTSGRALGASCTPRGVRSAGRQRSDGGPGNGHHATSGPFARSTTHTTVSTSPTPASTSVPVRPGASRASAVRVPYRVRYVSGPAHASTTAASAATHRTTVGTTGEFPPSAPAATTQRSDSSSHQPATTTRTPAHAATRSDGRAPTSARTTYQGDAATARAVSRGETPRRSRRACRDSVVTPTTRASTTRTDSTTNATPGYIAPSSTRGAASRSSAVRRAGGTGRT